VLVPAGLVHPRVHLGRVHSGGAADDDDARAVSVGIKVQAYPWMRLTFAAPGIEHTITSVPSK
jgi:hypothetical protein